MKYLLLLFLSFYLQAETISFGIAPRYSPSQTIKKFKPFADKIEKDTGLKVKILTTKNIASFKRKIAAGVYDMAFANPLHYIAVNKLHGYEAIAKEDIDLYGIIIVKKDSDIHSVKDLKDKTVSFPAPSAYAATKMTRVGIFYTYGFDITDYAKYVGTLYNVMKSVSDGDTKFGGTALDIYNRTPELNKNLRIIYTTKPALSHPIFIHPRIKHLRDKITNALISMSKDDLNGSAFKSIVKTSNADYINTERLMRKDLDVE